MPRSMNHFDAASDGQYFPGGQRLVDGNRLQSLVGMEEQLAHQPTRQTRRRNQGPKRTSTLGHRDIELVHVSSRTGFPHDRGGAADMIRVAVGEHPLLELGWRTAQPADRPEDYCLLTRVSGVDQRQSVIGLDQEGVCKPHWDDVHTFDHTLHSHRQNPPDRSSGTAVSFLNNLFLYGVQTENYNLANTVLSTESAFSKSKRASRHATRERPLLRS